MPAKPANSPPNRAELRRQQADARRERLAAELIDAPAAGVAIRPAMSFAAQTLSQALPRDLIAQGRILFEAGAQPRVALYDPALLAPNPQRGRVLDRHLEELARSLDAQGQQEPILARLITEADRQRWPDAFDVQQVLLILKGHRIHKAQPLTGLRLLRVELMLPEEDEDEIAYARRALRRASIRMMQSQAYDIFDKVNLYQIWQGEFGLAAPKDQDVAAYFEISRSEAQRVKTVAKLDPQVARSILESERRPADEVIFHIANRPSQEHQSAYKRFGQLTVAAVRRLAQAERDENTRALSAASGRPRNYALRITAQESPISYLASTLTPQQWIKRGGADAFRQALRALADSPALAARLLVELGDRADKDDFASPTSGKS